MNRDDSKAEPAAKWGKDQLPLIPANVDKLKMQLEQLAAERKNKPVEEPNIAPRFGGR